MTNTNNKRPYTRQFWAKARPYRQRGPERIHLLEHHLADVGACFEALLEQPTIRHSLACSAGLSNIDEATDSRLSLFAALHDVGKVNVGFQTQIWRDDDLPSGRRPAWFHGVGHTLDLTPILNGEDDNTAEWFFDALGWWNEAINSWDDQDGETVCAFLVAALSHHGQPLNLNASRHPNPQIWRPYGELCPSDYVKRLGCLARRWFPAAFSTDAPPLPSSPALQHMFLGLCTLADWIGSNEVWFPFCDQPCDNYFETTAQPQAKLALSEIGLDISDQRTTMHIGLPTFNEMFGFQPNAIQQAAANTSLEERLAIIESETGSGKTEAALWRFARMYEASLVDGLYFALPTRAAATQLHGRITRFVDRTFSEKHRPEVVLAVPGYLRSGDFTGDHLQDYEVWWHDDPSEIARRRRWPAERPKRYLAAQIAVGTVDQAMMSALKVKHAHMRAACLARSLLVVDEVHASDTYMSRIIKALLDTHLGAGGYALLMSATLGSSARQQWLSSTRLGTHNAMPMCEAIKSPYPALSVGAGRLMPVDENGREKMVRIDAKPLMHRFDGVVAIALEAARDGARVLVIRNTVGHAIDTQQAVERASLNDHRTLLFSLGNIPTLHHGRFAATDRRRLDYAVEEWLGKKRQVGAGGVVVVGTQTLEQSLDIDADLLITDLCPADVLLQRMGRLHRHKNNDTLRPEGYKRPRCIVLTPEGEDLSPLLKRGSNSNGLGPHGHVYEDLRTVEATRRLVTEFPQWRIPEMNRKLVERATHPDALEAIVQELGDDWRIHANELTGGEIAEGLTAAYAIIQRDKDFFVDNDDVQFGTIEERIRTRLGDDSVEIEFKPPPPSPFDPTRTIDRLPVSVRWLAGADVEGTVAPKPKEEGGFTFAVGTRTFRYDRLGLQRED